MEQNLKTGRKEALDRVEKLAAYEVLEKKELTDIGSYACLCRHKKTGARVALLSNDDDNKVFNIGFRTTPKDSTGVAHIMEHSVLCGSRDFPLKDPFVELCKGSLNTFLNAMTYPDKTLYPVASCNDKDFQNLMHVYLDAVFYPNIYGREEIFRQEGWHYELNDKGELVYNGVVYNEMKGALSSPDSLLWREVPSTLYPHTTYSVESGGDPEFIPDLTYEQFLDFHRTYYHPANSYIYLYGDMDMAEKLTFIDEKYLSKFDALEVHSEIASEPVFTEPARRVKEYPISEGESVEDNTYLSWSFSLGENLGEEQYRAWQILNFALCSVPGAPVKQALIDRGIGKDVFSMYEDGIKQPFFGVVAKGASVEREEEFKSVIRETLQGIVDKGFEEKALLSAINYYEFQYREADFGRRPKGLMYGIQMMDSWLYDDSKPFAHFEANRVYADLRGKVKEGYFEALIKKGILENPHCAAFILIPREGMAIEQEEALKKKLAEKKAKMSQEELDGIRDMMEKLNAFRETEDAPEDLARIPLLTRGDLKREESPVYNEESMLGDTPALYHNIETNGIGYLRLIFKIKDVPKEYFPYIGLLHRLFCNLNTANYTYGQLCSEINLATGGLYVAQNNYPGPDSDGYTLTMEVCTKALHDNLERALELMEELILTSDFTDTKRLKELLAEKNSSQQEYMMSAGHSVAAGRAFSYFSRTYAADDELNNITQYRIMSELEKHFEERKGDLVEKMQTLAKMIFRPENLMVDFIGAREYFEKLAEPVSALKNKLYTCEVKKEAYVPVAEKKNEGFMNSGKVLYVCRAGDFKKKGLEYKGTLQVLRVMMGYEYLWMNIRVKGGAYGCMSGFARDGRCYFVSYRDPNLGQTIDVYEKAAEFIENYQADERTMTQYIIGTLGELDTPRTAAGKGNYSREVYMSGITYEMLQKSRDEVLDATPEDIRELAAYIRAFMEEDCLCVVGNEQKVKSEEGKFMKIENLF